MGILSKVMAFAALAGSVTAYNETGPFYLKITGKEDTAINGYAGACHAGAALEGLCYVTSPSGSYNEFYYNYSSIDYETYEPRQPGLLTWILPFTGSDGQPDSVPSALDFTLNYGSNVAVGIISPGTETGGAQLSFYPDTGIFYVDYLLDDSSFNETRPDNAPVRQLSNFFLCYQYTGGYYYRSIAWVSSPPAQNPSCEPVDLSMEAIQ